MVFNGVAYTVLAHKPLGFHKRQLAVQVFAIDQLDKHIAERCMYLEKKKKSEWSNEVVSLFYL